MHVKQPRGLLKSKQKPKAQLPIRIKRRKARAFSTAPLHDVASLDGQQATTLKKKRGPKKSTKTSDNESKFLPITDITLNDDLITDIISPKNLPATKLKSSKNNLPFVIYRTAFLRKYLHNAASKYYNNTNGVELTDQIYDKLFIELGQYEDLLKNTTYYNLLSSPQTTNDNINLQDDDIKQLSIIQQQLADYFKQQDAPQKQKKSTARKANANQEFIYDIMQEIFPTEITLLSTVVPKSVLSVVGSTPVEHRDSSNTSTTSSSSLKTDLTTKTTSPDTTSTPTTTKKPTKRPVTKQTLKTTNTTNISAMGNKLITAHKFPMLSIQSIFDLSALTNFFKNIHKQHSTFTSEMTSIIMDNHMALLDSFDTNTSDNNTEYQQQKKLTLHRLQTILLSQCDQHQQESLLLFNQVLNAMLLMKNSDNNNNTNTTGNEQLSEVLLSLTSNAFQKQQENNIFPLQNGKQLNMALPQPPIITNEYKYDGIAIGIEYINGKYTNAMTRGDGQEGYVVTSIFQQHAKAPLKFNITQFRYDLLSLYTQQFILTLLTVLYPLKNKNKTNNNDIDDEQQQKNLNIWNNQIIQPLSNIIKQKVYSDSDGTIQENNNTNNESLHSFNLLQQDPFLYHNNFNLIDFNQIQQDTTQLNTLYQPLVDLFISTLQNNNKTNQNSNNNTNDNNNNDGDVWSGNIAIRGEAVTNRTSWKDSPMKQSYSSARHYVSGLFNSLDSQANVDTSSSDPSSSPSPSNNNNTITGDVDFLPYSVHFPGEHPDDIYPSGNHDDNSSDGGEEKEDLILSSLLIPKQNNLLKLLTHRQRLALLNNQEFTKATGVSHIIKQSTTRSNNQYEHDLMTPSSPIDVVDNVVSSILQVEQKDNYTDDDVGNEGDEEKQKIKKQQQKEESVATTTPTKTTKSNSIIIKNKKSIESLSTLVEQCENTRPNYSYECDGLVLKVDSILLQSYLGATSHHPRWAAAPKFKTSAETTTIEDITLQVGKSGKVVPVAHLKPVKVDGSMIKQVVLHNHNILYNNIFNDMCIGDEVLVEKRGGAIPMIMGKGLQRWYEQQDELLKQQENDNNKNDEDNNKNNKKQFNINVNLGKKLIEVIPHKKIRIALDNPDAFYNINSQQQSGDIEQDGEGYYQLKFLCPCKNQSELEQILNPTGTLSASYYCISNNCREKILSTLSYYASNKGLDIATLSNATLEQLYNVNIIKTANPTELLRLVYNPYYRNLLYKLGGYNIKQQQNQQQQQQEVDNNNNNISKIKKSTKKSKDNNNNEIIDTPWDNYSYILPCDDNYNKLNNNNNTDDNTLQQQDEQQQINGFQKKKIENILKAIEKSHQSFTVQEHNILIEKILLGIGLTTTHIKALQSILDNIIFPKRKNQNQNDENNNNNNNNIKQNFYYNLLDLIGYIDVQFVLQYSPSTRLATATDLVNKFNANKEELLKMSLYPIPALEHIKPYAEQYFLLKEKQQQNKQQKQQQQQIDE